MAHTLANDKAKTTRESAEPDIIIIDPDQEEEIKRLRAELLQSRKERKERTVGTFPCVTPPPIIQRKRTRAATSSQDEPSVRRLKSGLSTRLDVFTKKEPRSPFSMLTDDLLIEVFQHLQQLPHLLRVRQVCKRWLELSCNPRLWTSLSFSGQEHITSANLQALCKSTTSLRRLKRLSLAKIHGVSDSVVRLIPRTECAATLESVDLSWCSGASDKSVVEFSRCPGLRELRLSHCRVSRRSVRILAVRCPRLEVLDMNCINDVRDSLLQVIGLNCPYLRVLNIANGKKVSDDGITHITNGCPRLEVLDMSWCDRVTDLSISKIAMRMHNLRDVGLSETCVTDVGISELTRWCGKLEAIHLARCINISNHGIESIIRHCNARLTSLNLASCQNVSDEYVERLITDCPVLQCLDVSKLPCRNLSDMLERVTSSRDIQVYF